MTNSRECPRGIKAAPHYLRQDEAGAWYCPLERDAEREAEWLRKNPQPRTEQAIRDQLDILEYNLIGLNPDERLRDFKLSVSVAQKIAVLKWVLGEQETLN